MLLLLVPTGTKVGPAPPTPRGTGGAAGTGSLYLRSQNMAGHASKASASPASWPSARATGAAKAGAAERRGPGPGQATAVAWSLYIARHRAPTPKTPHETQVHFEVIPTKMNAPRRQQSAGGSTRRQKRTARDRPRPPARNGTEGNGRAHPGPEGGAPQAAADNAAKGRAARMPYAAPAATTQLLKQVPVASCQARPV